MKANLLLMLLLCAVVSFPVYSQTTIGRMKVDQYPTTSYGTMTYGLTYVPADYDPSKQYPLIIFMHGAGEGGDGVAGLPTLLAQGLPWWINKGFNPSAVNPVDGKTYEFIVVCPQAPSAWKWSYSYAQIQYILPDVLKRYSIDQSRIYITGLSAGGAGTWSCVTNDATFAKKIAAIMPNSDAGLNNTPVEGPYLKDITSVYGVPVWCVDGGNDGLNAHTTVYVDTINAGPPIANPKAVQTIIPGACHCANAWDSAYSPTWRTNVFNQNAYEWMLRYKRDPAVLMASAGPVQTITLPVSNVTLSGSGSPVAPNTISSYAWTEVSGPSTATIGAASAASTGASGLVAGTYTFQLIVKDNTGATATSTVTVTVNPAANVAPTVSAGSTQTIQLPVSLVTLTGTATGNGGATISSTGWTQTSGPNTAVIASASSLTTGASGLVAGTYVFQLMATDNHGLSKTATVTITVKAANVAPTVSAGSTQTIQLPVSSVTLTGTATGNGGATISSTSWTQVSGPNTAVLAAASSLSTGVSGLAAGTYVFQLSAKDNNGLSSTSTVTITVKAANVAPTVNAGSAQTIQLPVSSVTLTGTATGNGGATISSSSWTQTSGPNTAVLASASGLSTGVSGLVAGTYIFKLLATDNNGLSSSATVTVIVNAANVAPTVSAGSNQTIQLPVSSVTLIGTATGNGGATISSTSWTQSSGPGTAVIASASSLSTGVSGLVAGTYTFKLSAIDNNSLSSSATVTVIVNAATFVAPTVNAGSAQTIQLPVSSVTLIGTATGNGGATISSTSWTQSSGPGTAVIASASSLSTGVSGLVAGTYVFELIATDNNGLSDAQTVTITVKAANVAPTVNAGSTKTIQLPVSSVTLKGTATGNGGATISSSSWTQVSGPGTAVIATASALSTGISGLIEGTYTFKLTATDNNGLSDASTVTVIVKAANVAPTVSAGTGQTIQLPVSSVNLTGTATANGGATISSTTWTQTSGPSTATIASAGSLATTISGLVEGVYIFKLSAIDNNGLSATDQVTVTAASVPPPPANTPPVANAGADRTVQLPLDSIRLDGSASYDPDGTVAGYDWIQLSGPGGCSITSANTVKPSIYGQKQGQYVFQLTVTDNAGATDAATVMITVTAATVPPPPPPGAKPPVANAGRDTAIALPNTAALLDGSASADPSGGSLVYQWTQISGPATATIAFPNEATTPISSLQMGLYVFRLTVTNATGLSDTATVKVRLIDQQRTGSGSTAHADPRVMLYPNPVQGVVHIRFLDDSTTGPVQLSVYDMRGKLIMAGEVQVSGAGQEVTFDMSGLTRGVYVLRFAAGNKISNQLVVKQ